MANVGVWSGKYYFEVTTNFGPSVRLKLNDVRYGWCLAKNFGDDVISLNILLFTAARKKRRTIVCLTLLLKCSGAIITEEFQLRHMESPSTLVLQSCMNYLTFSGDVIGCGINPKIGRVDFWINGRHLGMAVKGFGKSSRYHFEDRIYYPKIEFNCDAQLTLTANLVGPFVYVIHVIHAVITESSVIYQKAMLQ